MKLGTVTDPNVPPCSSIGSTALPPATTIPPTTAKATTAQATTAQVTTAKATSTAGGTTGIVPTTAAATTGMQPLPNSFYLFAATENQIFAATKYGIATKWLQV